MNYRHVIRQLHVNRTTRKHSESTVPTRYSSGRGSSRLLPCWWLPCWCWTACSHHRKARIQQQQQQGSYLLDERKEMKRATPYTQYPSISRAAMMCCLYWSMEELTMCPCIFTSEPKTTRALCTRSCGVEGADTNRML